MPMSKENEEFNQYFLQLVLGLQSSAWMGMGKTMNPATRELKVDLNMARDSIDTLLMLKEKTKGNLTQTERGLLENAMQDLELNFIEVTKKQEEEQRKQSEQKEEKKEKKSEPKNSSHDQKAD